MQVCTLLQTDNHASNPPLLGRTGDKQHTIFTPNQQCEITKETMTAQNSTETVLTTYPLIVEMVIFAQMVTERGRGEKQFIIRD